MKRLAITAAVAASIGMSGCATTPQSPYGYNSGYYQTPQQQEQQRRAVTGAAVGAGAGAIAGAVLPGLKPGTGAIAGALLGGVLGATVNGRQYYRDTRGYCYYVDPRTGQAYYNYNVRC